MPPAEPLTASEEAMWRALMRVVVALPRQLDTDMVRATGLTANEYKTLMGLSESPHRELRMTDLANVTGLSASRMTRLADSLQERGFLKKVASSADGRGTIAKLTPQGFAKLKSAWPAHLASVRARVFDHVDPTDVNRAGRALNGVAAQLEERTQGNSRQD
jgi:DNA-binding MarR family transcriptional regulator